ncbi:hypothetical protein AAFF_G00201930 [Aldrovandia affinis]|uniref:Uncharacterized protein n=1 Tax=Aldrovandia affinis TaxID=143900 RepID=A0AAD7SY01_9TELE|nr:hypothetical protein AAFF_G00201930 [Aldrovandia affinis]
MSFHIVAGDRTEAERLLYQIVEADSDLDLSDEEHAENRVENEVASVEERESSEEEAGGSSDEQTDTDEQESRRPLWARTSTKGEESDSTALNRPAKNTEQYLDFKLHLAEELLNYLDLDDGDDSEESGEEYEPPMKMRVPQPEPSVRKYGARHMPEMVDCKHAERCRNQGCKGKPFMRCTRCKMFLCITKKRNCFQEYHH